MLRACIFDLDGTLANTLQSLAWFGNTALEKNGYRPVPVEAYKQMVGSRADMLIRRMLKRSAGIDTGGGSAACPADLRSSVRRDAALFDGSVSGNPGVD